MADRSETARALIEIALTTFRDEILTDLSTTKRYQGAMTANALAIAARALAGDAPADKLLAGLGGDAPADLDDLVAAIREGRIGDASHPGLRAALIDYLRAELATTNPRFLASRQG